MNKELTEKEETRRGELIAERLHLRRNKETGRYELEGGDKTALGVFRTLQRVVEDGE